ncbi:MAG: hypothetical protein JXX14_10615 [Deltaproteobacteria bacterium]|nr:hypothetical protein [Deltaproteobacteria bacterium]
MIVRFTFILAAFVLFGQFACSEASEDTEQSNELTGGEGGTGQVRVVLGINASQLATRKALETPGSPTGSDADGDGGIVAFSTPQRFWVALKKVTFLADDGSVDVLPDTGRLTNAVLLELTDDQVLDALALPVGNYHSVEMELYYYQLEIPLYSADSPQAIRVYLSDDDFPDEGMGGHHQGDITLVNEDGTEIGWVDAGMPWTDSYLLANRGDLKGAGGTDSQTGHARGLFGDGNLWENALFQQGASQDIYIFRGPLNLNVRAGSVSNVEVRFQTQNTWFFEDFDGDGIFSPCQGGDANGHQDACWYDESSGLGADWAPLFPMPVMRAD